jgi:hypothetical protein
MIENDIKKNKYLLFRNIFTMKPLSIVTISYNQQKERFKIFVYNSELGELYRKELTLQQITKIVLYTPSLLKLKKYKELGKMIYKAYKNSIIIHSY